MGEGGRVRGVEGGRERVGRLWWRSVRRRRGGGGLRGRGPRRRLMTSRRVGRAEAGEREEGGPRRRTSLESGSVKNRSRTAGT